MLLVEFLFNNRSRHLFLSNLYLQGVAKFEFRINHGHRAALVCGDEPIAGGYFAHFTVAFEHFVAMTWRKC